MSHHAQMLIGAILGLYGVITGVRGSYRASINERQRHICIGAGILFAAMAGGIILVAL